MGYFKENNRIPEISLAVIHRDLNYYQLILTNLCIGKVKKMEMPTTKATCRCQPKSRKFRCQRKLLCSWSTSIKFQLPRNWKMDKEEYHFKTSTFVYLTWMAQQMSWLRRMASIFYNDLLTGGNQKLYIMGQGDYLFRDETKSRCTFWWTEERLKLSA